MRPAGYCRLRARQSGAESVRLRRLATRDPASLRHPNRPSYGHGRADSTECDPLSQLWLRLSRRIASSLRPRRFWWTKHVQLGYFPCGGVHEERHNLPGTSKVSQRRTSCFPERLRRPSDVQSGLRLASGKYTMHQRFLAINTCISNYCRWVYIRLQPIATTR